jgi:hypothetical protein
MRRKTILGITITTFFFFILFFLYFKSNQEEKIVEKKIEPIKNENQKDLEVKIESFNTIEDVSYSAKDIKGNEYFLKANEGTIDQNEDNFIFLKYVNATIKLKDYRLIEISSDFGKYNIKNYDTIFSKNVIITYLNNKISGDYLDFSLDKNLMIISRNVVMINEKSSLKADVIEVNIETKDIKIFMYEENKKVIIDTKN